MNERQKILAFMTMYAVFVGGVGAGLGLAGVALFCVGQLFLLTAILP